MHAQSYHTHDLPEKEEGNMNSENADTAREKGRLSRQQESPEQKSNEGLYKLTEEMTEKDQHWQRVDGHGVHQYSIKSSLQINLSNRPVTCVLV